jgi:hypothetical protein
MRDQRNLNEISRKRYTEHADYRARNDRYSRHQLRRLEEHSAGAVVHAYFHDIESVVCERIRDGEVVVGCVAWLTSDPVLLALQSCDIVSIVVQKEDFLRIDEEESGSSFKARLRDRYSSLRGIQFDTFEECYPGQQECHPSYNGAFQSCVLDATGMPLTSGDAVRCLGYHRQSERVDPVMHH